MAGIAGKEGQCASKNNCNLSNTRSLLYLQTYKQNSTIRPFLTIANGLVAIGGTECTPHSLLPLVRRGNRVCPSMFCPFIKKGKKSVPLIVLSLHEKGEKERALQYISPSLRRERACVFQCFSKATETAASVILAIRQLHV